MLATLRLSDSFIRIRVIWALGRFGLGLFGPGHFGQFLGRVVSALEGGSFRPIFGVSRFGPGSSRPKSIETNQRTNGPANAHLISEQIISKKPGYKLDGMFPSVFC